MGWGWNPDTVIAVSTLVAAIAAATAGFFAYRSFSQMKSQTEDSAAQLRMAQERNERAQADRISAWTDAERHDDDALTLNVVLQNASEAPIYDIYFAVRLGSSKNPEFRYAGQRTILAPVLKDPYRTDAADAAQKDYPQWARKRPKNPYPLAEIIFRDVSGVIWMRSADGNLKKYTETYEMPGHWVDGSGQPVIKPIRES